MESSLNSMSPKAVSHSKIRQINPTFLGNPFEKNEEKSTSSLPPNYLSIPLNLNLSLPFDGINKAPMAYTSRETTPFFRMYLL
jgi:hypothetical protein